MEDVEEDKKKHKGKERWYSKPFGFEFKLRCVKLRLEEGLPVLLCKEVGASKYVIRVGSRRIRSGEKLGFVTGLSPREADGSFPARYARRSSRSRSVSLSLVLSGFPIF